MQKSSKVVTAKTVTAKTVTAKTAVPVKQETAAVKQETAAVKPVEKPVEEVKQETLVFETEKKETEKPVEKKETEKKETEKKETEKKTVEKKTTAKKTTGKKAGKKPVVKAAEKVEEIYVQFSGQELLTKEVLERAKQAYIAEGHRESSIKSIRLYIKPEEHMAYYVINEKIAGGVPV